MGKVLYKTNTNCVKLQLPEASRASVALLLSFSSELHDELTGGFHHPSASQLNWTSLQRVQMTWTSVGNSINIWCPKNCYFDFKTIQFLLLFNLYFQQKRAPELSICYLPTKRSVWVFDVTNRTNGIFRFQSYHEVFMYLFNSLAKSFTLFWKYF